MNISTNDQMELCEALTSALIVIAKKQGKSLSENELFSMIFEGEHCDIFDRLLEDI